MHVYVCEHCKQPIERQTRLVSDEFGLHFYHVTPDCRAEHLRKKDREAFDRALNIQRMYASPTLTWL